MPTETRASCSARLPGQAVRRSAAAAGAEISTAAKRRAISFKPGTRIGLEIIRRRVRQFSVGLAAIDGAVPGVWFEDHDLIASSWPNDGRSNSSVI